MNEVIGQSHCNIFYWLDTEHNIEKLKTYYYQAKGMRSSDIKVSTRRQVKEMMSVL